jgi:cytochrome c oxidase accessory protein FixG
MSENNTNKTNQKDNSIDLYTEGEEWVQNLGEKTVHAKRMAGRFRLIKWFSMFIWSPFFLLPYFTWDGRQAILFDTENRMYHIFNITIFPQDIWLLTMVLLFLAILLAFMTTLLGRVFCGYFCFQTVWTDIFTKIEEFFEGNPTKRRKLENAPWNFDKIWKKTAKHIAWLSIAVLSGITWMLYFGVEWADYFNFSISTSTLAITSAITLGAYIFAGFMREQTCLWVCPYARIQGAMIDKQTILPAYDYHRGEKRGKLLKGKHNPDLGDCIDCNQCIAVCPTGVDIRKGQEYGCITCGLCIDACDSVMTKIGKPTKLIKYTSLDALKSNKEQKAPYKRPRILLYGTVLMMAFGMIVYGMLNLAPLELKVLHGRAPLFVQLSDGSVRNKYDLKIVNKTDKVKFVNISVESDIKNLKITGDTKNVKVGVGTVGSNVIYLAAQRVDVKGEEVIFVVDDGVNKVKYTSKFFK